VTASAGHEAAAATTITLPTETQPTEKTLPWSIMVGAGCLILLLAVVGAYAWKKRW